MWQPLAANLAATAFVLLIWSALSDWLDSLSLAKRRIGFGVIMAVSALGSMMMAFEAQPGVFLDFRGPLIAVAGFIGGMPAVLVTSVVSLLYRLHLGGALPAGIASIGLSAMIGWVSFRLRDDRKSSWLTLSGLAIVVSLHTLPTMLFLPANERVAVLPSLGVHVALMFAATLLLGFVLLRESQRRDLTRLNKLYRAMVEALPDSLNMKDSRGRFLAANSATAKLMNLPSSDALVGKTDFDFYPAEIASRFRKDEEQVLAGGVHLVLEQSSVGADGSLRWLSTLKAPLIDHDGETVGMITHNRDITEAKATERKLGQTQAYLDQALANMSDGLAMYDASGALLFCNRRYQEMFPRTASLREPGASLDVLVRMAVAYGEEHLPAGLSVDEFVERKIEALRRSGEQLIDMVDGRKLLRRTTILDDGNALLVLADVTEQHALASQLEHQALHDPLTGLPNRSLFNRELGRLTSKCKTENSDLLVMLLDLDRFKQVNDNFGHAVGDALLIEVSRRLEGSIRKGDVAARLGGDEFAILVHGHTDDKTNVGLAERLLKALAKPMDVDGVVLIPGSTIGFTVFPCDDASADELLKHADAALYRAKRRRRGSWAQWGPDFDEGPALASDARG